jgi:CheY-like chemotaxis protein
MPISAVKGAQALVILVVEDEFLVRCNVADCLRDAGYLVVEADSGEEAIAFGTSGAAIDIVFTDIDLASTASGWDVADYFRVNRPGVPVVYTSGKSVDPRRRVPGSLFIPKPYVDTEVLNACLLLRTSS